MIACLLAFANPLASAGEIVRTPNVEAELVAERAAVAPGETIRIALRQKIRDGWHTYWRNAGDAGEPTRIHWLEVGDAEIGDVIWPLPRRITIDEVITNYGFMGEVLLPMTLTVPADAAPGTDLHLVGHATWLVCEDICIPEDARLSLTLPIEAGSTLRAPKWGRAIEQAVADAPAPSGFDAGLDRVGEAVRLTVASPALGALIAGGDLKNPYFFPYSGAAIDHNAAQPARFAKSGLALDLTPAFGLRDDLVDTPGVLAFEERRAGRWARRGVEIDARPGAAAIGAAVAPPKGAAGRIGVGRALVFAFLGGLILNLMPCVFPVLSIKALGVAQRAHEEGGALRRHGLLFLAGVMFSFLALAGALLALKAAGSAIGWGYQLQTPVVIAGLALLFFAIGLNLLGFFDIGTRLQGAGGRLTAAGGDTGAFFTGVLAVVVASPCTAPFMGAAVGFAVVQPALIAMSVFALLGLGLAAPFVALSFAPGLAGLLPRPGPWMVRVKQFLSIPMFATVAWLVWVLDVQAGGAAVAALAAMAALAVAVWLGRTGRRAAAAVAIAAALTATAATAMLGRGGRSDAAVALSQTAWSPEKVAALRAAGRPVFVDFTAAWCITCQYNKRTVLTRPDVARAFEKYDVAFLTADWTARDPVIAETLLAHGRSGVPLYLVYPPGEDGEPIVLAPLLTEGRVIEAVADVAGRR